MVSVKEAEHIILSNLHTCSTETVPVREACGRVLAEQVFADRDLPPFDRVTMDGIAVSYDSLSGGINSFPVRGIQRAGEPEGKLSDKSSCVEVMTGAVLPSGSDTVIRYEDVTLSNGIAVVRSDVFQRGQNIHRRGTDCRSGAVLLEPAVKISPAEVSVLASVGKPEVSVVALPRVAILSTGDELVPVDHTPEAHQIRQSNSYTLDAALGQLGLSATMYHASDDKRALREVLAALVDSTDVLLISGGVSKGKYDYVPAIFEELEVRKHFHGVSQRPGKPFWFGTRGNTVVFAFPGNPVSTFLCFQRYFVPWWNSSIGLASSTHSAVLAEDFSFQPPLTYFLQVRLANDGGVVRAFPAPGGGSGDFANLRGVDAFLELPSDRELFRAGEVFHCIPFRKP